MTHSILVFYFEQGYHIHRSLLKKHNAYTYIQPQEEQTAVILHEGGMYLPSVCLFLVERAMYTIKADTEHISSGQVPVIPKNQPLYIHHCQSDSVVNKRSAFIHSLSSVSDGGETAFSVRSSVPATMLRNRKKPRLELDRNLAAQSSALFRSTVYSWKMWNMKLLG